VETRRRGWSRRGGVDGGAPTLGCVEDSIAGAGRDGTSTGEVRRGVERGEENLSRGRGARVVRGRGRRGVRISGELGGVFGVVRRCEGEVCSSARSGGWKTRGERFRWG
jgi:hypothetical protein